jgi:hypothetical protein
LLVEITKTTGKAQKDTRYEAVIIDEQPEEPDAEEDKVKKVQERRKK